MSKKSYVPPNKFAKTAIWLRGDLGRTIVYPSFSNPDNLSTSSGWGNTNITVTEGSGGSAPGGHAFNLLTATGSSGHYVAKTLTNGVIGSLMTTTVDAKAGTSNFLVITSGGATQVHFNISTGVITSTTAGATGKIKDLGSSCYRCSATFVSAYNLTGLVYAANASDAISYTAAGETIYATNVTCTQPGAVSAWANQGNNTSLFSNVSQATFNKMPTVSILNNKLALSGTAASLTTMNGSFSAPLTQPYTEFLALSSVTGQTNAYIKESTNVAARSGIYEAGTNQFSVYSGAGGQAPANSITGAAQLFTVFRSGSSSVIYANGTSLGAYTLGTQDFDGLTLFSYIGGITGNNCTIGEYIVYTGDAVADGTFTQIQNYLKTFWRIG